MKPDNFPVFLVYNVVWAYPGPATNLYTCCALGYHVLTGVPVGNQTYAAAMFDTTGFFFNSSDTSTLSQEVAERMDDPLGAGLFQGYPTPLWGHTG